MGLLGSKHFVQYPTIPLSKIAFAFNADMIGRMKNQHWKSTDSDGKRFAISEPKERRLWHGPGFHLGCDRKQ